VLALHRYGDPLLIVTKTDIDIKASPTEPLDLSMSILRQGCAEAIAHEQKQRKPSPVAILNSARCVPHSD